MSASILTSIKKVLGIVEADESFDADILMFTNTVFSILNQIGIGPDEGFQIEDKVATWESFLGTDPRLNNVKTYMYLKVRLLFDPPSTSFAIKAMEENILELETRISMAREVEKWENRASPITLP